MRKKIFVDLEATSYTSEAIAVGLVTEDGHEFHSLIKADKRKLSKYIAQLTGINKEDMDTAPHFSKVMTKIHKWIPYKEYAFIVFGDFDKTIMEKTLERNSEWTKGKALHIARNIRGAYDFNNYLKRFSSMGIVNFIGALGGTPLSGAHNPLVDAKNLLMLEGLVHTNTEQLVDVWVKDVAERNFFPEALKGSIATSTLSNETRNKIKEEIKRHLIIWDRCFI